jgi:hypothetical protein
MRISGLFATLALASLACSHTASAQIDQGQAGAWYTYAWTDRFENSNFGWQGDIQQRLWDTDSDMEQQLVRGGGTWTPTGSKVRYTLGGAYVRSGTFGPSSADSEESRLYQEAFIPQTLADKYYLTHRWRLEQRWVDGQDQRNRIRYFVGLNVPLNQSTLGTGAVYLSFYNELFVNLERNIGNSRSVDYFDRNRAYAALGYSLSERTRLQAGYMWQESENFGKGQFQLNLFQNF